ncbi:MAG: hypothetical protein DPW09_11240 [Anaerolineae bacterium]|nr:hypothetical protein [Anaerolineales bacterium]MCQ3974011.1 hypothetical protein [Anaerolineae bacterium]
MQADLPGVPDCVEPALTVPAASPVHIQSIQAAGPNPDADGLALKVTTSDGSLPTVVLSRYQASATGLDGAWETVFTGPLPTDGALSVPGQFVNNGENLYRVMVEDQPGVEDVEGFYAVTIDEHLALTESGDYHQRQALVFRDTVREVIGSNRKYAAIFPEQLVVAMGTAETGSMFNNATANSDGIMQVTCNGGKGTTEGQDCDTYAYTDTAASIKFNVSDALSALFNGYQLAKGQQVQYDPEENCKPIPELNNSTVVDPLVTSVVYYNGWSCYLKIYKRGGGNPWYLHSVARQLDPQLDDPNPPNLTPDYPNAPQKNGWRRLPALTDQTMNIAQFFADTDDLAGVGLAPDLVERLDYGQNYVNQNMQ